MIAHGYKPGRAVAVLLALWLSGVALFWGAPAHRVIAATRIEVAGQRLDATSCPPRYPCFNPAIYAAETILPIVKLNQGDFWQPAGKFNRYRLWAWTATGLGWVLTTTAVAGLTGIIRKA